MKIRKVLRSLLYGASVLGIVIGLAAVREPSLTAAVLDCEACEDNLNCGPDQYCNTSDCCWCDTWPKPRCNPRP